MYQSRELASAQARAFRNQSETYHDVLACPVCGAKPFLETATDIKRRAAQGKTLEEVRHKLQEAQSAHEALVKAKGYVGFWLLGGTSPS